ncbi:MAG: hypothetical protein ED555_04480 [Allomuricauda sp.]|nr:MAG: hypothetical protein ED555_04480 [Allomuricauda sp.]
MYNDSIIGYDHIDSLGSTAKIIGDSQQISFLNDDFIRIMPAYFRNFGNQSQVLIVRLYVDKKFGFRAIGKVESKEFGQFKIMKHEWVKNHQTIDDLLYAISLKEIDMVNRKPKILRDTITVTFGEKKLLFTPSK